MSINWLQPDEFPKPLCWMVFYTEKIPLPHDLGRPQKGNPEIDIDPLITSIDAITA